MGDSELKIQSVCSEAALPNVDKSQNDVPTSDSYFKRVTSQGLPCVWNDLSHINGDNYHNKSKHDSTNTDVIVHPNATITIKSEVEEPGHNLPPRQLYIVPITRNSGEKETKTGENEVYIDYADDSYDLNDTHHVDKHQLKEISSTSLGSGSEKPQSMCLESDKSFMSAESLQHHGAVRDNIQRKVFICEICGREMLNQAALNTHVYAHKNKKSKRDGTPSLVHHECAVCHKTFGRADHLKRHVLTHTNNVKPFLCSICHKGLSSLAYLQYHMKGHLEEKPFTCSVCDKGFLHQVELATHQMIHTGQKPFKCMYCDVTFCNSGNLKQHVRSHTGEKPFTCEICSKSFSRTSLLSRHMSIHSGLKPYKCTVCDRAFSRPEDVTSHMRTHTGEQPYKCRICNKAFSMSCNLAQHMRTHTGEKPHKCQICDRAFSNSNHVSRHMKTHLEKTFKCDHCGKAFKHDKHLKRHIMTHTGNKPFKCTLCPKSFCHEGHLRFHLTSHEQNKNKAGAETNSAPHKPETVTVQRRNMRPRKELKYNEINEEFDTVSDVSDNKPEDANADASKFKSVPDLTILDVRGNDTLLSWEDSTGTLDTASSMDGDKSVHDNIASDSFEVNHSSKTKLDQIEPLNESDTMPDSDAESLQDECH